MIKKLQETRSKLKIIKATYESLQLASYLWKIKSFSFNTGLLAGHFLLLPFNIVLKTLEQLGEKNK